MSLHTFFRRIKIKHNGLYSNKMLIIQFLSQPTQTHQYSEILLTVKVKVTTVHKGVHLFISPDSSRILEAEKVHHQYNMYLHILFDLAYIVQGTLVFVFLLS